MWALGVGVGVLVVGALVVGVRYRCNVCIPSISFCANIRSLLKIAIGVVVPLVFHASPALAELPGTQNP